MDREMAQACYLGSAERASVATGATLPGGARSPHRPLLWSGPEREGHLGDGACTTFVSDPAPGGQERPQVTFGAKKGHRSGPLLSPRSGISGQRTIPDPPGQLDGPDDQRSLCTTSPNSSKRRNELISELHARPLRRVRRDELAALVARIGIGLTGAFVLAWLGFVHLAKTKTIREQTEVLWRPQATLVGATPTTDSNNSLVREELPRSRGVPFDRDAFRSSGRGEGGCAVRRGRRCPESPPDRREPRRHGESWWRTRLHGRPGPGWSALPGAAPWFLTRR